MVKVLLLKWNKFHIKQKVKRIMRKKRLKKKLVVKALSQVQCYCKLAEDVQTKIFIGCVVTSNK